MDRESKKISFIAAFLMLFLLSGCMSVHKSKFADKPSKGLYGVSVSEVNNIVIADLLDEHTK
jgi:uncharacterized protein YceK